MGGFLVLSFAYRLRDDRLPNLFDLLLVVVAALNALGFTFNLFTVFRPYYDGVVHFATTAVVTLVLFHVIYEHELGTWIERRTGVFVFAILTLALGLGAAWELVEYSIELLFGHHMILGVDDMANDLLADLLGGIAAVSLGLRHRTGE